MVKDINKMISKNIFIILPIIIVLALVHGFTSRNAANSQANSAFIGATSVDDPAGARLESVEIMGFASNFGLQQGDIVRKINGQTVKGADSFIELMGEVAEDSVVKIEVLRDGIETTVGRGVDAGSSGIRMNGLQRHT